MKTVICFGTFDLLHKGHEHFLKESKKLGNRLIVVVARDDTVKNLKKRAPIHTHQKRMINLKDLKIADEVIIGRSDDKYRILQDIRPDIIALGYDQRYYADSLVKELEKRKINAIIIRISAHKPHTHKSSILRKKMDV